VLVIYAEHRSFDHLLADFPGLEQPIPRRRPAVAFYWPQGDLDMHAGYSDVEAVDRHIAQVVDARQRSALWPHAVVIVTVDENGGWWDHVAPPKGDRWGPGTRIPALVI